MLENKVDEGSLVAQIYEAATEPALWLPFIRTIAHTAEARTGVIYRSDLKARTAQVICAYELDPSRQPDYERYYNALDIFQPRALQRHSLDVSCTHKFISDSELEKTEFYCDFLRPQSIFYATGCVLTHENGTAAIFGLQRDRGDGPFDDTTELWLNQLTPHIRRSLHIARRLEASQKAAGSALDAFATWSDAVLIADGGGRILFVNAAAEQLLAAGPFAPRGSLSNSASVPGVLVDMIAAAVDCAGGKPFDEALPTSRILPINGRMLAITVLPFRLQGPIAGTTQAAALLTIRAPAPESGVPALARRYGLTAAEARLWRELLAGKALKTIAGESGVSVETLRIHLKRLFQKTGVHRQTVLMRLGLLNTDPTC